MWPSWDCVGNDLHAEILKGLLSAARNLAWTASSNSDGYQTIVKTRIIARQQHVVRVDRESPLRPEPACPRPGHGAIRGHAARLWTR